MLPFFLAIKLQILNESKAYVINYKTVVFLVFFREAAVGKNKNGFEDTRYGFVDFILILLRRSKNKFVCNFYIISQQYSNEGLTNY